MYAMLDCRDRVGSRFAIEIAPDLVLSPHLYGWRAGGPPLSRITRRHRGQRDATAGVTQRIARRSISKVNGARDDSSRARVAPRW
jgi:hypothetical protein